MPATKSKFTVKFRGVRGSHPVPGPGTVRFGGNTACVEIRAGKHLIVLDAGTGIITLGNDLMADHIATGRNIFERTPIRLTILFSHTHHDHTQGFSFFKPVYLPTTSCYLYGPRLTDVDLEGGLIKAMVSPYFPVELRDLSSIRKIQSIRKTEMILFDDPAQSPKVLDYFRDPEAKKTGGVRVRVMHSLAHPNGGVFVYRIEQNGKSVVFATDTEGYVGGDQRLIEFAKGTDLLIHDSQYMHSEYTKNAMPVQGFGHSSVDMAAEVAESAEAGQLALFHYDPVYEDKVIVDMEKRAKSIFKNSIAAFEGLEINL